MAKKKPHAPNIGALWIKKSRKCGTFWMGNIRGEKIFIFMNFNKRGKDDPDFTICTERDLQETTLTI